MPLRPSDDERFESRIVGETDERLRENFTPDSDVERDPIYKVYARDEINERLIRNHDDGSDDEDGDEYENLQGWHTEKLCAMMGFSEEDTITVIAAVNRSFQRKFEVYVDETATFYRQQFVDTHRSASRLGDPDGFFGLCFKVARKSYHALEHVPLVNDLRLWACLDIMVLRNSKLSVVQYYVERLRRALR
ncbi:MAG: hypothetical protein EAZ74_06475 [Alphaproteobacteria bacterium]|nr:MAG: hypothetical protein EAY76_03105 [Alphaproteobacteria bacterium]TAF13028.1 MAG: hypothetical protein EAZ74_06475 [Alphaproteobacteria bacterium]TAF76721.1 MAG: hypothetical protein EAZ52_02920 [Alphaproteobacteria bacterium]